MQTKRKASNKTMKVTLLQTDIEWENQQTNIRNAQSMIEQAEPSDLYVLPEMWTTGFTMKPQELPGDEGLAWMKQTAHQRKCAICGSIATRGSDRRFYNRTFFVYPDGHYDTYDKRHLFAYGGESECYTPGTKQTIAEYKGFRIMIATCYDLRFPVWLRNTTDYDALIVVANWPQNRHDVWQTLLKARAIENQCFAIGCNRTGKDPYCDYIGGSAVIDAKGRTVGQARTGIEDVLTADIELESLHTFRSKFNALADKDPFMLI